MINLRIGYIRVSTEEQNLDRQKAALSKYDIEKWFEDKASGRNVKRTGFQEMMTFVREGDAVYVSDFSRLARSTKDLLAIVEELKKRGVDVISLKENLDSSTATGKLMLTVMAAIGEFERECMLERQREGIELAKQKGKYKGRKAMKMPTDFCLYYDKWQSKEMSKSGIAKALGVSRPTVDRFFEMYMADRAV